MAETLARVFMFGGARPKIHVAMSVATAFVAYNALAQNAALRLSLVYLQQLAQIFWFVL